MPLAPRFLGPFWWRARSRLLPTRHRTHHRRSRHAALAPRAAGFGLGYLLPAAKRALTKPYTQEQANALQLNGPFDLGSAFAEVCLVVMHALTFGAGVPALYPLAGAALLLCTLDTKVKLRYMWPVPPRFDMKVRDAG
jgi:hypothetical protein